VEILLQSAKILTGRTTHIRDHYRICCEGAPSMDVAIDISIQGSILMNVHRGCEAWSLNDDGCVKW
jgi:hypothetical protein